MSRIITFSRYFPAYHPRKGEPTYFVEGLWESIRNNENINSPQYQFMKFESDIMRWKQYQPKHHTIRAGNRWKVGDKFSPRVWSGKPYNSKQIIIAPDIEIKKVWDIEIVSHVGWTEYILNGTAVYFNIIQFAERLAANDGLNITDFMDWFNPHQINKKKKVFSGQIICWNENIIY